MNELSKSVKHMNLIPLIIFLSLLGLPGFILAAGEFKVHPQPKSDSGHLHFLQTAASECLPNKIRGESQQSLGASGKAEASEPISLHSIILNSRLTFQRSPLMGAAGEETVRGGSFG